MVLKMLPAEEADFNRAAVIENKAYAPLETNQILFPGPFPPNILELRAEELKEQAKEPNMFCLKVIDTELEGEQMIAFARWVVYDDTYPPKPKPRRERPPGTNAEAFDLLFGNLTEMRDRAAGGKNRVYLQSLYTDPKHQGRGAASMLVSWGVEEAAKRGLPAYLESTVAGHNVYLRHNFRDIEELALDFSKWGLEEPERIWAMVNVQGS